MHFTADLALWTTCFAVVWTSWVINDKFNFFFFYPETYLVHGEEQSRNNYEHEVKFLGDVFAFVVYFTQYGSPLIGAL